MSVGAKPPRGRGNVRARCGCVVLAVVATTGLGATTALGAPSDGAYERIEVAQALVDPWVPPAARKPSPAPPTQGAALRAQVERKLKAQFDTADVDHSGKITRAQARGAGLAYIADHFDAIDRRGSGQVSFDDVKRFMRERGASLD